MDPYNPKYLSFSSGISKNIDIRNDVAVVSDIKQQECDLQIKTDEIEFKKILVGLESPISSLASGKIEVEGGSTQFLKFLSMFR